MWSKWSSKTKNKVILEVSLDLKIFFIYTLYSYRMKKILHLNVCCLFLPKKSKTLYGGHLLIADTFLGTADAHDRQVWLYIPYRLKSLLLTQTQNFVTFNQRIFHWQIISVFLLYIFIVLILFCYMYFLHFFSLLQVFLSRYSRVR